MSFATFNFNANIYKAIQTCGYNTPTPIQLHSIPEIMAGKDVVASAQTGSGKTAAFVLPSLDRLSKIKSGGKPRILILTPTRELATQITDAASKYGKFFNFNIVSLVGGMPYRQQLRALQRPVDMIVATPGRLMDHMENRRLDLSQVEILILDEADRMLDMGFIDDVRFIAKATPKNRQTLLFSATVDNKLTTIIQQLLNTPVRIEMATEKMTPAQITQEVYIADNSQHKERLLQHFLHNGNIYKGIIFSATKINADKLVKNICATGISAAPLHGDLKQNVRNRTVELLRKGKIQFLVATDIAARGIDISDVTHVINYDLPKFAEDYVHRIGRTGRAGKKGTAISFVMPVDGRHLQKIERFMKQNLEVKTISGLEATKRLSSNSEGGAKKSSKHRFSEKNKGFKSSKNFQSDKRNKEFKSERGSKEFKPAHKNKEFQSDRRSKEFKPAHKNKEFQSDRRNKEFKPAYKNKEFQSDRRNKEFEPAYKNKEFQSDRRSKEFKPAYKNKEFQSDRRSKDFEPAYKNKEFKSDRRSKDFEPAYKNKEFKSDRRSKEFEPAHKNKEFQSDRRNKEFKPAYKNKEFQSDRKNKGFEATHKNKEFQSDRKNKEFKPAHKSKAFQSDRKNKEFKPGQKNKDFKPAKKNQFHGKEQDSHFTKKRHSAFKSEFKSPGNPHASKNNRGHWQE